MGGCGVDSCGSRYKPLESTCECGNKPWGVIKCRNCFTNSKLSASQDGLCSTVLTSVQTHVKSFTASEPQEPTGQFLINLRDILWLILQYYPSIQLERLRKLINLREDNRDASNITPKKKHSVLLLLYQSVHHMIFNFTEITCQLLPSL